ncbi:MAG: hypothetical protein HQL31_11205 [Planctomycetes bacterium]|nr:hypothetical protein [Planctomycetota bacterium]
MVSFHEKMFQPTERLIDEMGGLIDARFMDSDGEQSSEVKETQGLKIAPPVRQQGKTGNR